MLSQTLSKTIMVIHLAHLKGLKVRKLPPPPPPLASERKHMHFYHLQINIFEIKRLLKEGGSIFAIWKRSSGKENMEGRCGNEIVVAVLS